MSSVTLGVSDVTVRAAPACLRAAVHSCSQMFIAFALALCELICHQLLPVLIVSNPLVGYCLVGSGIIP